MRGVAPLQLRYLQPKPADSLGRAALGARAERAQRRPLSPDYDASEGCAVTDDDAERLAYLSWSAFRARMEASDLSDEGRTAALWAIDVLAPILEDAWLRGSDEAGSIPSEILYAESHTSALCELIELALFLHLLEGRPGMAAIRRDLKRDLRADRRVHTRSLLELACLAAGKGWLVAVEGGDPPSDVAVSIGPEERLVVEIFVSLADELMRTGMDRAQEIQGRIRAVTWPRGVEISGHFDGGTADEEEEWFAALDVVSLRVQRADDLGNSPGSINETPQVTAR